MGTDETDRPSRIAALNDRLRRTGEGGQIALTRGVQALGEKMIARIMSAVQEFDQFSPDNDPHQEHDFGSVYISIAVNWKIDYYDPSLTHGSEDPTDQSKTCRVLTIMLREEY